ncbi:MAG: DUF4852 domain-containing protein [Alphaproteobacteria bacterium]|jgi:hypothetical protein|nr:DUF4852 domain-containing protein [Alphaproteobacteria bacterium]
MKKTFLIIVLLLLTLTSSFAQEEMNDKVYQPKMGNIIDTFVKFSDSYLLDDRSFLDDYIAIKSCEENKLLFSNEMEREKYRNKLKESLLKNKKTNPHIYRFVKPLYIEKYDFDKQRIILNKRSFFNNISNIKLPLSKSENKCAYHNISLLKKTFFVDLDAFINLKYLDLPLEKAEAVIPNLAIHNKKRIFFIVVTLDFNDLIFSTNKQVLFGSDVLDISFSSDVRGENIFAKYDFNDHRRKTEEDYLEGLNFKLDSGKSTY